jgi:Fe-S-cluster containining protein
MDGKFTISLKPHPNAYSVSSCYLETPQPLEFHIAAGNDTAGLSDLVPVARTIADMICQSVCAQADASGEKVPCQMGCSVCCTYLVPLSTAESMRFAQDILALPSPRRAEVTASLLKAAKAIIAAGKVPTDTPQNLCHWYSSLGIECPLLKKGLCSIYASRPIACREHLVTGSPCNLGDNKTNLMGIPVSVTQALAAVGADLEGTEPEAIMLPLVFPWYKSNTPRVLRSWPAPLLAEGLAAALCRQQITHAATR